MRLGLRFSFGLFFGLVAAALFFYMVVAGVRSFFFATALATCTAIGIACFGSILFYKPKPRQLNDNSYSYKHPFG